MSFAGHAYLTAHDVSHIRRNARNRDWLGLWRSMNGSHQKNFSFVAIIYDRSTPETYWRRPPDRALFRHQFHFGVRLRRRLTMCALRGDQQRAQCRDRGDAYMTVEKHIAL